MGYTTDFFGEFNLTPNLTKVQKDYLNKFSESRRLKRDVNKLMEHYKGEYGYPGRDGTPEEIYGKDGQYFVGGEGFRGQDEESTIIDFNTPPGQLTYEERKGLTFEEQLIIEKQNIKSGEAQPGLWCQWVVGDDIMEWDGNEKFYEYESWLQYLTTNFFQPWGVMVNGNVEFQGEDREDRGKIVMVDNVMSVLEPYVDFR